MFDRNATLSTLKDRGYEFKLVEHAPLKTVEDAARLRGALPGAQIKNLVLKDRRNTLYLVVLKSSRILHLQKLRRLIGCTQLSFASVSVLTDRLGVLPGAVSPLALINVQPNQFQLVMDAAVLAQGLINVHPLDNRYTVQLKVQDLLCFLDWQGFEPMMLNLD